MKKTLFVVLVVCCCLIANQVMAAIITLKSGSQIEGEIMEINDSYVKIAVGGYPQIYYQDVIENIDEAGQNIPPRLKWKSSAKTSPSSKGRSWEKTSPAPSYVDEPNSQRYFQSEQLFAIDMPQGWQLQEREEREVTLLNPVGDNSIVIQFKPQSGSTESIVKETTRTMKLMFDWHQTPILTESEVIIDGVAAHLMEYLLSSGDGRDFGVRYIFAHGGYSYIVSFLGASEEERTLMKEIVGTMDFPPFQTTVPSRQFSEVPSIRFGSNTFSIQSLEKLNLREMLHSLDDPQAAMKIMAAVLILLFSALLCLVGTIMLLVAAFKTSILWGIACLLLPIVELIFIVVHWKKAKKAFFILLLSTALMVVSGFLVFPMAKKIVEKGTNEELKVSIQELIDKAKHLSKDGVLPKITINEREPSEENFSE